jgi:MFS family permease
VESIITPLIAGFLYVQLGLTGLFLINFFTCLPAMIVLLAVRIPQPRRKDLEAGKKTSFLQDAAFGWKYLAARSGLMGLTLYFALVNFLLNFAAVLTTPLILSTTNAAGLGIVQAVFGIGMLLGSLLISVWGGPKKNKMSLVFGALMLMALGFILIGIRPGTVFVGTGYFLALFALPVASAVARSITQAKVAPEVQGRVFAIRSMITQGLMPIGFMIAGPLADKVFEPLMQPGGGLANGWVGSLLGTGAGRGMGLMFVLSGSILIIVNGIAMLNHHIRNIEHDLPDVIPETIPVGENQPVLVE